MDVDARMARPHLQLPFTFHNDANPRNVTMTPEELVFSAQLVSWWTSFVSTGDPNAISGQAFQLPKWDPVARQNVVLNLTSTVEDSVEVGAEGAAHNEHDTRQRARRRP